MNEIIINFCRQSGLNGLEWQVVIMDLVKGVVKGLLGSEPEDERNILLMGETGSGKSTIINYLANYFLEGSIKRPKVVIPTRYNRETESGYSGHTETDLDNVRISQTRFCKKYSFRKKGHIYTFIDTPGLSDTGNSATNQVDDESILTILSAASEGGSIHAIILVINGSTARVTVNVQNALLKIAGNCPDVLLSNLIVIYTKCTESTRSFDPQSLPFPPKQQYDMDNSAFCSDPATWTKKGLNMQTLLWKTSMESIEEMMDFIDNLAPQSTEVFKRMLENRKAIQSEMGRASVEIEKQSRLIEILEDLKQKQETARNQLSADESVASSHSSTVDAIEFERKTQSELHAQAEKERLATIERLSRTETAQRSASAFLSDNQSRLKSAKQAEESAKNYNDEIQSKIKSIKTTSYHNTNCRRCLTTCHENCGLNFTNVQGHIIFDGCASLAPLNGICKVCGCNRTCHVHDHMLYFEESVWKTIANAGRKADYERKQAEALRIQQEIDDTNAQLKKFEFELARLDSSARALSSDTQDYQAKLAAVEAKKKASLQIRQQLQTTIDSKRKEMNSLKSQQVDVDQQLLAARQNLDAAKSSVQASCRDIQQICKLFNFVDELNITKQALALTRSRLTTSKAREEVDAFIRTLTQLGDELTQSR